MSAMHKAAAAFGPTWQTVGEVGASSQALGAAVARRLLDRRELSRDDPRRQQRGTPTYEYRRAMPS